MERRTRSNNRLRLDHEEPYDVVHVKEKVGWFSCPLVPRHEQHRQHKLASPASPPSAEHGDKHVDETDGYPPFRRVSSLLPFASFAIH